RQRRSIERVRRLVAELEQHFALLLLGVEALGPLPRLARECRSGEEHHQPDRGGDAHEAHAYAQRPARSMVVTTAETISGFSYLPRPQAGLVRSVARRTMVPMR